MELFSQATPELRQSFAWRNKANSMNVWGLTDRGTVRDQNQDAFFKWTDGKKGAVLVCDGMGGARAGNVASTLAVQVFSEIMVHGTQEPPARLTVALEEANKRVLHHAHTRPSCRGMGTTLVGALVENDTAYVINVGDSRAYYISDGGIEQITRDHSLVEDLVRRGHITPQEARNHPNKHVITRALGVDRRLEGDLFSRKMAPGSMLLLCSDGLSNMLEDPEILFEVLHGGPLTECCQRLLHLALRRGATDNVTAVLLALDAPEDKGIEE